jgi:hypothetical protein
MSVNEWNDPLNGADDGWDSMAAQCLRARIAELEGERDAAKARAEKARAGEARAVEAIKRIFIGGNHLASALIGLLGPSHPPYEVSLDQALEDIGAGNYYDLWVAWKFIMLERDALAQPALAWLAQRERKAAEGALTQVANLIRQTTPTPYGGDVAPFEIGMWEGRQYAAEQIESEAAALRAGKGENPQ